MGVVAVRLHGGEHQGHFGACQRHIQSIVFFARACNRFLCQQVFAARRWRGLAGQKHKAARKIILPRPLHQYAHAGGFRAFAIAVQHQHHGRFQAFGAVDGEQLHRIGLGHLGHGIATGAQRAHKTVSRQKPPAIDRQRRTQERMQMRLHAGRLRRGHGGGVSGQHIPFAVNGTQGIMRRQLQQQALPAAQLVRYRCKNLRQVGG